MKNINGFLFDSASISLSALLTSVTGVSGPRGRYQFSRWTTVLGCGGWCADDEERTTVPYIPCVVVDSDQEEKEVSVGGVGERENERARDKNCRS